VVLVLAFAMAWNRERSAENPASAGSVPSENEAATSGQSGPHGEAPWRKDLDRLGREVRALGAELKRLAAVVEDTMAGTSIVDEGEGGTPLSRRHRLEPDPETTDVWDTDALEREIQAMERSDSRGYGDQRGGARGAIERDP
jgi:hypothetical protein